MYHISNILGLELNDDKEHNIKVFKEYIQKLKAGEFDNFISDEGVKDVILLYEQKLKELEKGE